jgi:hypothetical protein
VVPVRDLRRRAGAAARTLGIIGGTVTADHLDTGVFGEPVGQGVGGPLGQDIDGTAALDVDQDCAVAMALTQGEVVDTEHLDPPDGRVRQRADQAYQGVPADPC